MIASSRVLDVGPLELHPNCVIDLGDSLIVLGAFSPQSEVASS
jgi:hypothetical protein